MSIQANISNNLRVHRKAHSLSQEDLAEKLGVTSQAVSKWECMQSIPDIETVIAISNLLGVSMDSLLLGKASEEDNLRSKSGSESLHSYHNNLSIEIEKNLQLNSRIERVERCPDGIEAVIRVHISLTALTTDDKSWYI